MSGKSQKRKRRAEKAALNAPTPAEALTPKRQKQPKNFRLVRFVFFLGSLIGALYTAESAREWLVNFFSSEHEKFKREKYISGFLIPDEVRRDCTSIEYTKGREVVDIPIHRLVDGQEFQVKPLFLINDTAPLMVTFKLIDDRLYVKTKIFDVDRKYLGEVHYDRWELSKDVRDFSDTDTTLEVVDSYDMVAFGLIYRYPNKILTRGYSNIPYACAIYDNDSPMRIVNDEDCKDFILQHRNEIARFGYERPFNYLKLVLWIAVVISFAWFLFPYRQKLRKLSTE